MVAGENAETARVEGKLLVDAELGTQIGDRARQRPGVITAVPGVVRVEVVVQTVDGFVVQLGEAGVRGERFPGGRLDYLEERDRVSGDRPGPRIEAGPQVGRDRIPRPPQVVGDVVESAEVTGNRQWDLGPGRDRSQQVGVGLGHEILRSGTGRLVG